MPGDLLRHCIALFTFVCKNGPWWAWITRGWPCQFHFESFQLMLGRLLCCRAAAAARVDDETHTRAWLLGQAGVCSSEAGGIRAVLLEALRVGFGMPSPRE